MTTKLNQSAGSFPVNHNILRDRDSLILQWLSVRCKPPPPAKVPTSTFRLLPNDVVHELEPNGIKFLVQVKSYGITFACRIPVRSTNKNRGINYEETTFVQNRMAGAEDIAQQL